MRLLLDRLSKGGVLFLYRIEIMMFFILLLCFGRITYLFKFNANFGAWYNVTIIVVMIVFLAYLMIREILQVRAMYKQGMFNTWKNDYWNWLDVASFASCVVMLIYFRFHGQDGNLDKISSISSLLMWCKFLGQIRAFNQKISTFVLMLFTILHDIKYFMFLMLCVMSMFGQALFISLAHHADVAEDAKGSFDSFGSTLLSCYTMMLGEFDTDKFPDLFAKIIFALYMFIVVVCMLNVLIAIVSDSYDNAMVKSPELYYRSRLGLIAEISTAFNWLLKINGKIKEKENLDLSPYLLQSSSEGDEWAGKVLDIVKRINRNTGIEVEQVKRDLNEKMNRQHEKMSSQLDDLKKMLQSAIDKEQSESSEDDHGEGGPDSDAEFVVNNPMPKKSR